MPSSQRLRRVTPQLGRPLYLTVRDAVRAAIDAGIFQPGHQMPSTKALSERMKVSLVTMHRAMQELVSSGVLQRAQGRGTFVHERYLDRARAISHCRIGLVFHNSVSLADFPHGQLLEGVRRAAHQLAVDVVLLRFGEDVRNECDGFLFINPLPDEIEALASRVPKKNSVLVASARAGTKQVRWIDVDNIDVARQAVEHLAKLGHTIVGYVGANEQISSSRDRWDGFVKTCEAHGIVARERNVVRGLSDRLDERERTALARMLSTPERPTAIFAAGFRFALDVYGAATLVGLRVPEDLSIVGVDDPPGAAFLSPPMTTVRQPLVQLGHAAVTALHEQVERGEPPDWSSRLMRGELVVRDSSGPAAAASIAR